jgi:hypothetical protein
MDDGPCGDDSAGEIASAEMITFIKEDDEYLRWLDENPVGWVVNANRRPVPSYLIVHRATCAHISTDERENWTTNQYIKICSHEYDELKDWAHPRCRWPVAAVWLLRKYGCA